MPAFRQLGDAEPAALASHVRAAGSNEAVALTPALFALERSMRTTPFAGGAELKTLVTTAP